MSKEVEILAAIERGKQILAEQNAADRAAEAQREADERNMIAIAWQPVVATIQQATPDWVHPYIVTPSNSRPSFIDGHYDAYNLPCVINLSALITNIPTIRVWANPHHQNPSIMFEAGRYSLMYDQETSEWYVATHFDNYKVVNHDLGYFQPGSESATDAFHVVLAFADADRVNLATTQAEADDRTKTFRVPPTEPIEDSFLPAPIEPLERIAVALEHIRDILGNKS